MMKFQLSYTTYCVDQFLNCEVGHGFYVFEIGGINNSSTCNEDGYSDFTNLTANLEPGSTYGLTVT